MQLFETIRLELILQELAENVKEGYIHKLEQHDRHASGNLMSTVTTQVEHNGTTYEVSLNLQDYWKYVEEGTKPHWPPVKALMNWIAIKGIIPRPDKDGNVPKPKQLAFLIGRKIAREGTEGTHDLKKTTDTILAFYEERIAEALHRDALEYLEKIA